MKTHIISASVGIMLLSAIASFAQQVKTDYDRSTDFSQYKTYSWEKVQTQDPLWVDRIKEAVNAALAAKGWTPVESGGDVSIVAMEMTKNHRTLNTFYDGFGGGWRWGWIRWTSEMQLQTSNTTRSVRSLSICSTRRPRSSSGGVRPVTPFQTSPTKTSRILTRACRRCSITFLRARRNS